VFFSPTHSACTQVSYADVFLLARSIMEGPPHRLLESVAHSIAGRVLHEHSSVHRVRVYVRKLHIPALSAAVGFVGVEVFRGRQDFALHGKQ
jgi:7,8-dihydroneopterin aldolase/epimerase/oxygenase